MVHHGRHYDDYEVQKYYIELDHAFGTFMLSLISRRSDVVTAESTIC